MKLSEVFDSMKVRCLAYIYTAMHDCFAEYNAHNALVCGQKNMTSVAENNVSTLGLGLDLESRYQEAEKVCPQSFYIHHVSPSTLNPGLLLKYDMSHGNF